MRHWGAIKEKKAMWWMKAWRWPFSKYSISSQECCDLEATAAEIEHHDFPRILLYLCQRCLMLSSVVDKLGVSFSVNQCISYFWVLMTLCSPNVAAKIAFTAQMSGFSLFNLQKGYKNINRYCFCLWLTLDIQFLQAQHHKYDKKLCKFHRNL